MGLTSCGLITITGIIAHGNGAAQSAPPGRITLSTVAKCNCHQAGFG
jgi:hypothetical protein